MKKKLDASKEEIRDAIRVNDLIKCLQEQTLKKKKEDALYASIVTLIGIVVIGLYIYVGFFQ